MCVWRLRLRGAGQAARRKTGQVRRDRAGRWELYYYHSLTYLAAAWRLVGLARQQQGRLPDRAGLQCKWSRARPRLCGLQQISLALVTGTATGHSDSSSGTGLVSLRSGCKAPPPCLARKMANKR